MLIPIINFDVFAADEPEREIGLVSRHIVNTDGNTFEIIFASNFLVGSNTFNGSDKMLRFNIETGLEENNIGEIVIPRDLIDGEFIILLNDEEISSKVSKTTKTSVITVIFDGVGTHTLDIIATKYLEVDLEKSSDGGCLIATAAFGSEMSSQVQLLRELRDKTVLQTESGIIFMTGFNHLYYSFSPTIADYERENLAFKEVVKLMLIPLLASLTLLQYADIDSESEMLVYGIGVILLNIGMYFIAPIILIIKVRKRVNIEKLDTIHA